MSRTQLGTRSVIPAKAGIQSPHLWVPAFAGKTVAGEGMSPNLANVKLSTRQYTGKAAPDRRRSRLLIDDGAIDVEAR